MKKAEGELGAFGLRPLSAGSKTLVSEGIFPSTWGRLHGIGVGHVQSQREALRVLARVQLVPVVMQPKNPLVAKEAAKKEAFQAQLAQAP